MTIDIEKLSCEELRIQDLWGSSEDWKILDKYLGHGSLHILLGISLSNKVFQDLDKGNTTTHPQQISCTGCCWTLKVHSMLWEKKKHHHLDDGCN